MFVYFCLTSYPECGVKVFLTSALKNKYKDIINELKHYGDIDIKENQFLNYPKSNQELKALRWIIPEHHFKSYDNIYIGDVDILICPEELPVYDAVDNRNGQELPDSLAQRVEPVGRGAQPPYPDAPVDGIYKDSGDNGCQNVEYLPVLNVPEYFTARFHVFHLLPDCLAEADGKSLTIAVR